MAPVRLDPQSGVMVGMTGPQCSEGAGAWPSACSSERGLSRLPNSIACALSYSEEETFGGQTLAERHPGLLRSLRSSPGTRAAGSGAGDWGRGWLGVAWDRVCP